MSSLDITCCPESFCTRKQYRYKWLPNYYGLVDIYSCGYHTSYYCKTCQLTGTNHDGLFDHGVAGSVSNHYVKNHTNIHTNNKCPSSKYQTFVLITTRYGQKYFNIGDIIDICDYFIGLRPEFSFLEVFSDDLSARSIISAMRNKSFSCVLCGDRFESFPYRELYIAHSCSATGCAAKVKDLC